MKEDSRNKYILVVDGARHYNVCIDRSAYIEYTRKCSF